MNEKLHEELCWLESVSEKGTLPEGHSCHKLAEALRAANLDHHAKLAEKGYYHDYLSPLPMPDLELDGVLYHEYQQGNIEAGRIRERHHNGEFDATYGESNEWIKSADGQAALSSLAGVAEKMPDLKD